ncbi:MAG: hypothetical protein LBJ13_01425 [Puniceicoccales bacterium]|jgi:hypothetical protein|nr:hypothetical protein [Puniceicoccales bacterium]
MFSFSEIKFWPGAIDFCDKNNANGQYFSSTRGNKKNFRKKNLTGHRFHDLILGMVKKNLNKKVGCALIAAGLLAVSSIQGSSTSEESTLTETDIRGIKYASVRLPSGEVLKVLCPNNYCVAGVYLRQILGQLTGEGTVIVLFNSQTNIDELARQEFPGFKLWKLGREYVCYPDDFREPVLRNGAIICHSKTWVRGFTGRGQLCFKLNNGMWAKVSDTPFSE